MDRRRICAVAVIALVVVAGTLAQGPAHQRLLPVDQAATQPDFFTFRAQLLTAVARHDAAALMAVVHPNIKCDFGGGEGKAFFEEYWKPGAPGSEVWAELAAVLALGGTFSTPDTFVAPYVFSRWPQGVDSFEHVAVVGDRVRHPHRSTRRTRRRLAVSSFEILPLARQSGDAPEEWTAVTLAGRKIGYVASRFVRSPIGYRAYFSRQDGRWQMLMFIAGD